MVMSRSFVAIVVGSLFVSGGLFTAEPAHANRGGPLGHPVVFTAHDYSFDGPERIPAGMTTMAVVNKGQDLHHIQLLRLQDGKSAEDFREALKADGGRLPDWVRFVGGPNAIVPGGESAATMQLAEGQYVLICLIPTHEGVAHVALGMQKPLLVTKGMPSPVAEPQAALTITQSDFRFALSTAVKAGSHVVRVVNHGTQPHEVVVVKLAPGATAKAFGEASESGTGTPPGVPVGGIVGVEKDEQGYFTADFEPGRYGLICFFPDPATGKPHYSQGMTTEFTVR